MSSTFLRRGEPSSPSSSNDLLRKFNSAAAGHPAYIIQPWHSRRASTWSARAGLIQRYILTPACVQSCKGTGAGTSPRKKLRYAELMSREGKRERERGQNWRPPVLGQSRLRTPAVYVKRDVTRMRINCRAYTLRDRI